MTEAGRISFDPLLGWPVLWALLAVVAICFAAYLRWRGAAWLTRLAAFTVLAAALSNPAYVREEREPLPSVAALIIGGCQGRSESVPVGRSKTVPPSAAG